MLRGAKRWAIAQEIVQLRADGLSYRAIAHQLNLSVGTISGIIRDYQRLQEKYAPDLSRTGRKFKEASFTHLDYSSYILPVFDGYPVLEGDFIVAGDFHLPATDYNFAEVLLNVARAQNIRRLLIIGDWVNMDIFSQYEHLIPPPDFDIELEAGEYLLTHYTGWFTEIWMALGNHEHRLLKLSKGQISSSLLGVMLSKGRDILKMTPYSHIVVQSGDQLWRCTHQAAHSRVKGRVGDILAQKHQCHIIDHHQHHAAKLMDSYGRYVVIDNGGLFDPLKFPYVMLRDNTSPVMTKGFTVLEAGVGHLITPYPAYTNLSTWTTPRAV